MEQYFKLRVRNYAYIPPQGGVGSDVPNAFTKSASDGWSTGDSMNYYQEISFHKCTLADNADFYPPNKNFANTVNAIFALMYCIDNLDFLKFYGNFNTDNT